MMAPSFSRPRWIVSLWFFDNNFDPKTCDWSKPWAAGAVDSVNVCLGDSKAQKALAVWAGQYKRAIAQAKTDTVTCPLKTKEGKEEVDDMFASLMPKDGETADISSVAGGNVFTKNVWLFAEASELKCLSFLPNHAAMIKILACGKISHILVKWDTLVEACKKLGVGDTVEKVREKLHGLGSGGNGSGFTFVVWRPEIFLFEE